MTIAYNPLSGNLELKEPGPQGPAGVVSAAGPGSQGTPSISFAADLDTGLYNYTPNGLAISTNGTGRLFVDASGNVGVGTSTLTYAHNGTRLIVESPTNNAGITISSSSGSSESQLHFADGSAGTPSYVGRIIYSHVNDSMQFSTGATERMRLDSSGRLGLGTSSPTVPLQVHGNIKLHTTNADGNEQRALFSVGGAGDPFSITMYKADASTIGARIDAGGTSYFNGGNVGVGTTSPGAALDVRARDLHLGATSGGAGLITFRRDSGTQSGYFGWDAGSDLVMRWGNDSGSGRLAFNTNGNERVRIDEAGRLLVGTSSAFQNVEVFTSSAIGPQFQVSTSGSGSGGIFAVNDHGSNPGLGGNITLARDKIGGLVDSGMEIGRINFAGDDGTNYTKAAAITAYVDGTPGADDMPGRLVFSTTADGASSPTPRMTIKSDGSVGVGTTSPGTAATGTFSGLHIEGTATNGDLTTLLLRNPDTTADTAAKVSIEMKASSSSRRGAKITAFKEGTYADATQADIGLQLSTVVNDAYVDAVTIKQDGKVGVGTTSPTFGVGDGLEVARSGVSTIRVSSSTQGVELRSDAGTGTLETRGSFPLLLGTGGSERARIDSSGRLLVGTSTSPSAGGQAQYAKFVVAGNTFSATTQGILNITRGQAASGTIGADTEVGHINFTDSVGNEFARITCATDAAVSSASDLPGRLVFSVTRDGQASPTETMRIGNSGTARLFTSDYGLLLGNSQSAGTTYTAFEIYAGSTSTTSLGTLTLQIYNNGNVQNTNNSYGAISDIKLKENIVDATSQWFDIKSLQVRKYNFKEGQTHTQIGLIAQEVELVSPGLVTESPDRDANGNDLGTVTKSVNYSVLYMKAVKALQEAMERIETLEAKVAALETP